MYKISALRETGNKNQQVGLLSTMASVYSFDECKSFGFNINKNQYDYSKISNNNKISTLQSIIKNTKKIKDKRIEAIIRYLLNDSTISSRFNKKVMTYLNDLKDKVVARSTFFKHIPSNFKNPARKTDLCNICTQYTVRKKLFENKINTAKNKAEIEETLNEEEKLYRLHKFCVDTQKNTFNETIRKLNNKSCIIVLDFKQNMEIGTRPDSINLDHYNKQAISVLGFGVLYLKDDKTIVKVYFDYLSEILNHDSAYGDFTKTNTWVDTGNHFRSQRFPHYIFKEIHKINSSLNIDLNFFPEHHEKI
ncbi:hypothetical protein K502DRAFT_348650 [Neoconidiobolus thromboides FSU 785]|nr:hypothetical protein K502DRAFT_348650 [Neoconidiobolus thromboides FSU 785]